MRCGVDIVKRSGVDHHSLPWAITRGCVNRVGQLGDIVIGHFKAVYMWRAWINSLRPVSYSKYLELPGSPHCPSPGVGGTTMENNRPGSKEKEYQSPGILPHV